MSRKDPPISREMTPTTGMMIRMIPVTSLAMPR